MGLGLCRCASCGAEFFTGKYTELRTLAALINPQATEHRKMTATRVAA